MKPSVLALAATMSGVMAQNTTSPSNSSLVTIQSANNYSGSSLIGYHVGAALSYMVATSAGSGSSFTYNSSATSDQLLDNDIAAGHPLPCYVVVSSEISANAGPLECGAGVQPGDHDVVTVADSGALAFDGITAWFVCAVQSFTYGWVQDTVVGSYADGQPSGPGVENCTAIDALVLVDDDTTTPTTSTTAVSAGPTATTFSTTMSGTAACSTCSGPTTTVTWPCPSQTPGANTTQVAPFTGAPTATSPVAPFTGAAHTVGMSGVAGLVCAAVVLLL